MDKEKSNNDIHATSTDVETDKRLMLELLVELDAQRYDSVTELQNSTCDLQVCIPHHSLTKHWFLVKT